MKGIFEKNGLRIIARKVSGFIGFPPMFHAHCEIIYVISGNIQVSIDGNSKILTENHMCITFPYSVHEYSPSPDAEAIIIMFSPNMTGEFEKTLLSAKPASPYIENASDFLYPLLKIVEFLSYADSIHQKAANAYLIALTGEILLNLTLLNTADADLDNIQKVLTYCSKNYSDESISILSISKDLYISKSYVSKIFSQKLEYKFREYINILRISEAKKLLQDTNMKIVDIMYACGFKNQSSFNRVFLRECGKTPKQYRKDL